MSQATSSGQREISRQLLEYQQWRNFMRVVEKAKMACQQAGRPVVDHFADISKMGEIGSGVLSCQIKHCKLCLSGFLYERRFRSTNCGTS